MNEFITNPTVQAVMQVLAVIGFGCLVHLFCRRARKGYENWRKRQDELDKAPREFRDYVLGRLQVLIDTNQPIDALKIYDIINGPDGRLHAKQGCRINIDVGPNDQYYIVAVGNDKWRAKLLMPKVIPPHWKESDWPLDVATLNQCNEMYRITY